MFLGTSNSGGYVVNPHILGLIIGLIVLFIIYGAVALAVIFWRGV